MVRDPERPLPFGLTPLQELREHPQMLVDLPQDLAVPIRRIDLGSQEGPYRLVIDCAALPLG